MHKVIRLLIFIALIFLVRAFTSCFVPSVFDAGGEQSFWVWQWLSTQHDWIPYKDFFYPYGFFPFYAKGSDVLSWMYTLTTATAIFGVLHWIWDVVTPVTTKWNKLLAACVSIFFVWYSLVVYSVEFTARYGLGLAYGLLCVRLILKSNRRSYWFLLGILTSGLVFLVPDQGMYSIILLISVVFFGWVLSNKTFQAYFLSMRKSLLACIAGSVAAGLVAVIWLGSNNLLLPFFRSLYELKWVSIYAESPFLPYAGVPENLFIMGCIYVGLTIVAWKCRRSEKSRFQSFLLLSIAVLTTHTLLLEYKSMIRSVAEQIILICLPLAVALVTYLAQQAPAKFKQATLWIGLSGVCLFLGIYMPKRGELPTISHLSCNVQAVSSLPKLSPEYELAVQELLKQQPKKVFVFPADPIFYSFLNQQPPYTLYSYNYSPKVDQQRIVEYLQTTDVVVWNTKIDSMDGAPTLLRTPQVSRYIFQHFVPVREVGSFLFLQRSSQTNLKNWESWPTLKPYFSQLDFGFVLLNFESSMSLSQPFATFHLDKQAIATHPNINQTKIIVLHSKQKSSQLNPIHLVLTSKDGHSTSISASGCEKNRCILPLNILPIFYFDSALQSFELTRGENVTVELYSTGME